MLEQKTIPAKEVEDYDGVIFGNEMYRVYYATPNDGYLMRANKGGVDPKTPENHIEIALISDQRIGPSQEIMIRLTLHEDHPVTVVRTRK